MTRAPSSTTGPSGRGRRLAEAERAFEKQDFTAAADLSEAVTRVDPGDIDAWLLMSLAQDRLGRVSQAITALDQAIAHNSGAAAPHNALAPLYLKTRDLARAELHLRRAVEIDPAFAPAWHNLGKLLAASGQRAEAEQAFTSAVAAAPGEPIHRLELARFTCLLGRLPDTERLLDESDRLSGMSLGPPAAPQLVALRLEIANRMADAYLKAGQPLAALGHLEQAIALGAGPAVQTQFVRLLLGASFSAPRPSLKPILKRALDEGWADPMQLGRLAAKLLLLEADFRELAATAADAQAAGAAGLTSPLARRVLSDPLLLTLLERTLIVDIDLERLLTALRRAALHLTSQGGDWAKAFEADLLPFLGALANQSFTNEFAWAVSEPEGEAFTALLDRAQSRLSLGDAPEPVEIALLAAYGSLPALLDAQALIRMDWPAWLAPVITRQAREPLEEAELRAALPDITAIHDPGSLAVRRQYEENPFPRWVDPPGRTEARSLPVWVRQNFPGGGGRLRRLEAGERYDGLVAGCGTGQETASLSQVFSDVDWLAIDLSAPSLAYAARKSRELGLAHVSFARGDLLELVDRTFDVVVSAGVLHHLDDPLAGLRALRDLTAPGGVMLIALYSTLARRELVPARAFATRGQFGVSPAELRRYRADVLALPSSPDTSWRDGLLRRDDFYSLSMLRDLIFHVRETCFTVARIEAALKALDLRFRGFSVNPDIRRRFQARFGAQADPTSLQQWASFETENPDTFWHMYHFMAERA